MEHSRNEHMYQAGSVRSGILVEKKDSIHFMRAVTANERSPVTDSVERL